MQCAFLKSRPSLSLSSAFSRSRHGLLACDFGARSRAGRRRLCPIGIAVHSMTMSPLVQMNPDTRPWRAEPPAFSIALAEYLGCGIADYTEESRTTRNSASSVPWKTRAAPQKRSRWISKTCCQSRDVEVTQIAFDIFINHLKNCFQ